MQLQRRNGQHSNWRLYSSCLMLSGMLFASSPAGAFSDLFSDPASASKPKKVEPDPFDEATDLPSNITPNFSNTVAKSPPAPESPPLPESYEEGENMQLPGTPPPTPLPTQAEPSDIAPESVEEVAPPKKLSKKSQSGSPKKAVESAVNAMAKDPKMSVEEKTVTEAEEDTATSVGYDSIGIITPEQGALGEKLWLGTDRRVAEHLLVLLPINTHSRTLGALRFRLLASGTASPKGYGYFETLLGLRLRQLSAMGEYNAVSDLIARVPKSYVNEPIEQEAIHTLFRVGQYKQACTKIQSARRHFNTPLWKPYLIVCQLLEGKLDQAELGMRVLQEEKVTLPPVFQEALRFGRKNRKKPLPTQMVNALWQGVAVLTSGNPPVPKKLDISPAVLEAVTTYHASNPESFDRATIEAAWAKKRKLGIPERIEALASLYTLIESSGVPISNIAWYELLLASYKPPSSVVLRLLDDASAYQRTGETLALLALSFGDTSIAKADERVISLGVKALHRLGLDKEAVSFGKEALAR
ncbi:MAG: putative Antifreeze glycopeptide polyprotein [Rickettsiales bacterium]|nr:putative Antifreeze glycopeptide polyprotein [Rickettsiales bacterium]